MYQNINTKEILSLDHVEMVKNNPALIRVWVLSDGTRWNDELFFKHWRKCCYDSEFRCW